MYCQKPTIQTDNKKIISNHNVKHAKSHVLYSRIIISTLFILIASTTVSYSATDSSLSKWGLKADIEERLEIALSVVHDDKIRSKNKSITGASFVTVGGDSACDFRVGNTKIQNAVDSGASEIRIASNDVYEEKVQITDPAISLTIRGGFADCTQAENDNQSDLEDDWTEITRIIGQNGSIFEINDLPAGNTTVFENIKLLVGDATGGTSGGGVYIGLSDSDLVLRNMWLYGGTNVSSGGALSVISSRTSVILDNTRIFQNQVAGNGGGIYCNDFSGENRFASIVLTNNSSLTDNVAFANGGGAYLDEHCLLSSFTGSVVLGANIGIINNESNGAGGAVSLSNGAGLLLYGHELCNVDGDCFGDAHNPVSIYDNYSVDGPTVGFGGAIYATGAGTDISMTGVHFNRNWAVTASGGAIALFDSAQLTINRNSKECWDPVRCNFFEGNKADDNGGVLYNNGGTANISHSYFEDNQADFGLVFYGLNAGTTNIDTSVFNHNGLGGSGDYADQFLILGESDADHYIKYSTFADNNATLGLFRVLDNVGTVFLINSSIIDDAASGPVLAFPTNSGFFGSFCVMAHEIATFPGTNNQEDDPEFLDKFKRDYHLSNSSPAIDYCTVLTTPTNKDIDFQTYGFDIPNLSNHVGP